MEHQLNLTGGRRVLGEVARRPPAGDLLTSMEVVDLTGLSYRRLDYWIRVGKISPVVEADGSGTQRLFDPGVVDQIDEILEAIAACPNCGPRSNR